MTKFLQHAGFLDDLDDAGEARQALHCENFFAGNVDPQICLFWCTKWWILGKTLIWDSRAIRNDGGFNSWKGTQIVSESTLWHSSPFLIMKLTIFHDWSATLKQDYCQQHGLDRIQLEQTSGLQLRILRLMVGAVTGKDFPSRKLEKGAVLTCWLTVWPVWRRLSKRWVAQFPSPFRCQMSGANDQATKTWIHYDSLNFLQSNMVGETLGTCIYNEQ